MLENGNSRTSAEQLRLTEIFFSLQGETKTVGLPTVFIRLTGCPLRCQYCDTAYAFHGGKRYSIDAIVTEVKKYQTAFVTVTGGEPLAQKACHLLLKRLCDEHYIVSLETSGALSVADVDTRVIKVLDFKTPASLEAPKNHWENVQFLLPHDQVKFVICDEADYKWAKEVILQYGLTTRCEVLFSPCYQILSPTQLAEWILEDQLPVRMQIQLHKYLWGDVPGR
ncbi:MAG: 7-carboxy-7-deazaguanine synthase QueE [Gammaproteobacteria bacterium RIFCSPHIGHO2_12_FULL_38_14]|nr:MAG: 7-carboxy-7-deazaguanine synthase QueE [Gammaproteobacteria bacterium RIFCSPHIGHO2_12_FULL_38_14]